MSDDSAVDIVETLTDVALELTVIGQVLNYDAWSMYASIGLKPIHFWRKEHQRVVALIADIENDGAKPDLPTLRSRGADVAVLVQADKHAVKPHQENARLHAQRLIELYRGRQVYYESQDLERRLTTGADVAGSVLHYLSTLESVMADDASGMRLQDAAAQYRSWADSLKRRQDDTRVWMGIPSLDAVIDGLSPGEVLGIMARPGVGKTLMLGRYVRSVMDHHVPALFFSLEMPTAQIVTRLIQPEYQWTRQQAIDPDAVNRITVEDYGQLFGDLWICDAAGLSVAEMHALSRRAVRESGVKLILIDHMGLIGGHQKLSTYDRIGLNAREIKELAKKLDVAVVLALQVSRAEGGDGSQPLTLASVRDSGVIEEVVDYLIGLHRPERNNALTQAEKEDWKDIVIATVVKHRHGRVGRDIAVYIDERLSWTEKHKSALPSSSPLSVVAKTHKKPHA